MTVAHVREPKGADYAEVMFLESARIFKLQKKNPKYKETLQRLRGTVTVRFESPTSDIIQSAEKTGDSARNHRF